MAGSRATHNAKLLQRHQRQQSNTLAKTSANKFTQKQSQFERRREEAQVQQQQQSNTLPNTTGRNAGDGLLSRAATATAAGRGRTYAAPEDDVRDTPNPFARTAGAAVGRRAPTTAAAPATTRSATMGLERVAPRTTRTTRRIDRFNLTAGSGAGAAEASSLMGVRRVREGEADGLDGLDGGGDGGSAAPPSKVTRAERFRDMISSSKGQRAQLQRERAERDAATVQLDAEINGLLHLLPKRNKLQEEQEAFAQSGTPEVRALLASYKRDHEAKCLTLKSSGAFEVRSLGEAARSTATRQPTTTADGAGATAESAATTAASAGATPAFLDAADRALLARVRSGAARSSEEGAEEAAAAAAAAAAGAHGSATVSRQAAADAAEARAAPRGTGDDFDAMMHSFLMDPRRAHAVARTLTEEEEALQAAQQALLKEDRQQLPTLNLQEKDQTQLTRGEWVAQGGDVAFQMDHEDDDAAVDDNVDLPSSFEGDSEGGDDGDDVGTDVDGVDDDEDDAALTSDGIAEEEEEERVGGSAALDALLAELEAIAKGPPQPDAGSRGTPVGMRRERLHAVLTRLHRYATHHVLEVTKAFRLVLVEAERSFLRGTRTGAMRQTLLVYLYAITKVFPTSDYRHPVVTPFLLFVCSALMQMKLDSCEAVHSYLVLATLLLHCLKAGSGRYCAEVVVAAMNVLALQLPRAALEPARYQGTTLPVPLLDRVDGVLLDSSASGEGAAGGAADAAHQLGLFDTTHTAERLLLAAYRLYEEVCTLHRGTPAFPVMCAEPLLALDALLLRPQSTWTPSTAVRLAHEALCVTVRDTAKGVAAHRTPLAMRTFRPRPLRQFDPLLAEREENAVKNEVRIMKRDIREDKKRLMRHLTAEATVQRRAQEKRQTVDDAQREKRYHNVMNQLQQQQHSMNTVESLKARAKSKSRKGLSGASTATPAEDAGAE